MAMVELLGMTFVLVALAAGALWWSGRGRADSCARCDDGSRCEVAREQGRSLP